VDFVRNGFDKGYEEGGRGGSASLFDELHEDGFACSIDRDIQV
jgi:hypothetical protein